jgi:uncharacterized protein YecE (DUF72 family)
MSPVNIGTAGWTVPRQVADEFPAEGTSLQRYAGRFPVAEINSSFHRPHRLATWQRKLVDIEEPLAEFLAQAEGLGPKLAILLVQLPPKLEFDAAVAEAFFADLSSRSASAIVCEPRHPSWFAADADRLLDRNGVARVAADPAVCESAARPGGWPGLRYWRLHGSPAMYRSSYADRIGAYAEVLAAEAAAGRETWCIFDNTASGAAAGDALALIEALR